jgi:uridine phosphorylase
MPYLHPTADLAERVILVDDPGRALALAQVLCDPTPLMFNHARGLWGYSGTGLDGAPLTLQATGIGGPSAAIVVAELATLGARRFVLVGSVAGVAGLLVVETASAGDGTSRALGAGERVAADPGLLGALRASGLPVGAVHSSDVIGSGSGGSGGPADLETAAVLQAATRLGRPAAAVLVGDGADDDLVATAGRAALTALG